MKRYDLFDKADERIFTVMKICDFEEGEIDSNKVPHLHNYYSIFWIDTGEALHSTQFVEYSLKADTILFVPPGLLHSMYLDKKAGGITIFFNEEFVSFNRKNHLPLKEYKIFNNPDFKSLIYLNAAIKKRFRDIVDLISEEVQKNDVYSQDIVLNLLHLFLLESRRVFDAQYDPEPVLSEDTSDATIIRFKSLLEKNYTNQKSVSNYAEMLHMSPSCLNEVSKKATGITAGEIIRNRVMDEAKKLLFSSDLSGKEIAYQLGFDDPSYFSRFFKKYTGTTLNDFRKSSRKKYH